MDRKKIVDLRVKMLTSRVDGRRSMDFIVDLDACAGELLALADAALKIRSLYDPSNLSSDQMDSALGRAALQAMRDFDALEGARKAVDPDSVGNAPARPSPISDLLEESLVDVLGVLRHGKQEHAKAWRAAVAEIRELEKNEKSSSPPDDTREALARRLTEVMELSNQAQTQIVQLQQENSQLLGELSEIKELGRGTMGPTEASNQEALVAALGLLQHDKEAYAQSWCTLTGRSTELAGLANQAQTYIDEIKSMGRDMGSAIAKCHEALVAAFKLLRQDDEQYVAARKVAVIQVQMLQEVVRQLKVRASETPTSTDQGEQHE